MAAIKLMINDTVLLATPSELNPAPTDGAPVTLHEFRRNYEEPAKITFSIGRDVSASPLPPDSVVKLTVDGQLVFIGLLDPVQPQLREGSAPAQFYTARDYAAAMSNARLVDQYDRQTLHLDAGRLTDVLDEYLTHVGGELERVGLLTEFLFSEGAARLWTYPTSVSADDADAGLRDIAANTLGVRCFVDPNGGEPAYRFTHIWRSPTTDIDFADLRINELTVRQSTDGCVGAVRTVEGVTVGEYTELREGQLVPAWSDDDAARWTPHLADDDGYQQMRDQPSNFSGPDTRNTYCRLWSFAAFADEVERDARMWAFARVADPTVSGYDPGAAPRIRYEIVQVDWDAKTVLLRFPAQRTRYLYQSLGHDPFNAPPAALFLGFELRAKANINIPSHREPESGFGGRAVTLRPITCAVEQVIEVPAGISISEYATQAFLAKSEPITEGEIPFSDDMPLDLCMLDRRINITRRSAGTTGYGDLNAPVMGFTHDFAAYRGRLEFSDDRTSLMKGGN